MQKIDVADQALNELDVLAALRALRTTDISGWTASPEFIAETLAFDCEEGLPSAAQDDDPWFKPGYSTKTIEITADIVRYWKARAYQVTNPVLRARFAGLAWEYAEKIVGERKEIQLAQARIDAVVLIAQKKLQSEPVEVLRKLAQSLTLALSIRDMSRSQIVRETIIGYAVAAEESAKLYSWRTAYDLIVNRKKLPFDEETEKRIIRNLEDLLEIASGAGHPSGKVNPWGAQQVAERLARFYYRLEKHQDTQRVLAKVESAFDRQAVDAAPMLAHAWMRQVLELYDQFNCNDDASRVRIKIRLLGPAMHERLIHQENITTIQLSQLDAYADRVLTVDPDESIMRFVTCHIFRRQQTEAQLREIFRTSVAMHLATLEIQDRKGRVIATLSSLESEMDGYVSYQTKHNIIELSPWLNYVVKQMIQRFGLTADIAMSWIVRSPIFDPDQHPLVRQGIDAYFSGNHVVSMHLLVPQVEDAIRQIAALGGGDIYRQNRNGGMDLRTMDDLLRDPVVIAALKEDAAEYFRILYTDGRGVNLRNDLCHGMIPAKYFGPTLSDRVFHSVVLLCKIFVEIEPSTPSGTDEPTAA
jgi:hypothetical protein